MTTPLQDGFFTGADGHQLYFHKIGDSGKTVIVLHGGPGLNMNYFAPDMEPLGKNHTLIFYDQRSCGRSELVTDTDLLTGDHFVEDLEALRIHFHFDKMILLGHSWGSGLAALYAMKYPDRVQSMLLVDSLPPRAEPYMETFGQTIQDRLDPAKKDRYAQLTEVEMQNPENDQLALIREYLDLLMPTYLYDPASASNQRGDFFEAPPETLVYMNMVGGSVLGSLGNYDWREGLAGLNFPTHVIHGVHDPISLESAREWAEVLPDSRMLEIEECGHFPFFEKPDVFFPAVESYLNEI
jgi:proline iminopeptidase